MKTNTQIVIITDPNLLTQQIHKLRNRESHACSTCIWSETQQTPAAFHSHSPLFQLRNSWPTVVQDKRTHIEQPYILGGWPLKKMFFFFNLRNQAEAGRVHVPCVAFSIKFSLPPRLLIAPTSLPQSEKLIDLKIQTQISKTTLEDYLVPSTHQGSAVHVNLSLGSDMKD